MLVDGEVATVGTINLTIGACFTTMKMPSYFYRTQSIIAIERDFERFFKVSQEIYPHHQKAGIKAWSEIVQLFAPML